MTALAWIVGGIAAYFAVVILIGWRAAKVRKPTPLFPVDLMPTTDAAATRDLRVMHAYNTVIEDMAEWEGEVALPLIVRQARQTVSVRRDMVAGAL